MSIEQLSTTIRSLSRPTSHGASVPKRGRSRQRPRGSDGSRLDDHRDLEGRARRGGEAGDGGAKKKDPWRGRNHGPAAIGTLNYVGAARAEGRFLFLRFLIRPPCSGADVCRNRLDCSRPTRHPLSSGLSLSSLPAWLSATRMRLCAKPQGIRLGRFTPRTLAIYSQGLRLLSALAHWGSLLYRPSFAERPFQRVFLPPTTRGVAVLLDCHSLACGGKPHPNVQKALYTERANLYAFPDGSERSPSLPRSCGGGEGPLHR